ncbi:MAG: CBS domain-containing protein [SAR324 cluster bacterium]|nr:CBS domain-containing protein [SAR324 cluster bacterium]
MAKIEEILQTEVLKNLELDKIVKVPKSMSMRDTITKLNDSRIQTALVTENDKTVGILTQSHVVQKMALGNEASLSQSVESVMFPITGKLTANSTLAEAMSHLKSHRQKSLPVIDDQGNTVGVVSYKTLVRFIAARFSDKVYNLPPNLHQTSMAKEGA